ncbi:hypothetical protein [Silvanigrella sp.]|jgi:hypothetical protein|uniref:hypothetical protein n=1 Tax=Silvanigrella sp. TaxID=2024976 RepID=UPI0037CC518B|nr:hypothetical protein [Silvanigrellaceae bacterium]
MQLIKRKPHLGWIINGLAISLICFLMLNSLFGSIYVNQLKKKILGLTDNYFLAQREILEAKETLSRAHSNIYKFILANQQDLTAKQKKELKSDFIKDIRKDFIAIVSHSKEINKFNIDPFMTSNIKILTPIINDYTLTIQKEIDLSIEKEENNYDKMLKVLNNENENFTKIMFNLEVLSRLIQEKAISIRISDDLLLEYLPSVFILTFFAAAISGGSFIYVSRREVRKSIIDNTLQILTEAKEYQMDCIETLEICKEISEKGAQKITEIYNSIDKTNNYDDLEILIEKFKNHSAKIELAFEIRRFLHEKEKNKIEKEILENKKKAKSIY